jgi:(p)ppGpp synthase/HD superfamily hydrolase
MVARVTHVRVNPDDVEESVRLFDESVVPAAEQEEGFMGALLLVRDDGRALVVDLCDTLDHMRQNEQNGFYQSQVAKFAGKIVERPAREFYEVAVAKGVQGGPELLELAE